MRISSSISARSSHEAKAAHATAGGAEVAGSPGCHGRRAGAGGGLHRMIHGVSEHGNKWTAYYDELGRLYARTDFAKKGVSAEYGVHHHLWRWDGGACPEMGWQYKYGPDGWKTHIPGEYEHTFKWPWKKQKR